MRRDEETCEFCSMVGTRVSPDKQHLVCGKHYKRLKKENRREQKFQTRELRGPTSYK